VSSIFHWGKTEGLKAESGGGAPGEGSKLPRHQLGSLGSAVSSSSLLRGRASTAQRFSAIRSTRMASPGTIHWTVRGKTPWPPSRTPLSSDSLAGLPKGRQLRVFIFSYLYYSYFRYPLQGAK